jgi:excisionase family DNA binding protein
MTLSMTVEQAVERTGITRTRFYELFKEGVITPRKSGRRTLVLAEDLETYVKSLPTGVSRHAA